MSKEPELHDRRDGSEDAREPSPEQRRDALRRELGLRLRSAREQRNLSMQDVAARLHIRQDYLEALENADWERLPEEVYALGFLRQYARFLGEDVNDAITTLKSGDYRLTKPFTMPDPPIAPNRAWAIAAGLVFVLLLILFNTVGDNDSSAPPEATFPVMHAPPPPPDTDPESMPAAPAPPGDASPAAQAPPPASNASGPVSPAPSPDSASSPAPSPVATPAPAKTSTPPPFAAHRYRLTAIGSQAWLQVRDPAGALLREALLQPGQSIRIETTAPHLAVTCGNAAALQIEVDGQTIAAAGTLGPQGKVLRDFRITPPARD